MEKEGLIRAALPSPLSPLRGAPPCGLRVQTLPGAEFVEPWVLISPIRRLNKNASTREAFCLDGGEGGIRTLDTLLTYTPLAGERLQPLGHFSVF